MLKMAKKWWPAVLCAAAYYAIVFWCVSAGLAASGGRFVYPLDDTYIHMAMARNFSEHGVWGYTRYAFSSSTSSPLWTAVLALGYFVLGPNEWLPLALNLVIGTVLISYLFVILRERIGPVTSFLILFSIMAVTSVPALTLLGMEHLLHTLLTLMFVRVCAGMIAQRSETPPDARWILLLAALLPMTRYEGCFAIAWVCLLLLLSRRFGQAIRLAAVGAVPVLLYGLVSVVNGWLPIPNSVLFKGQRPCLGHFRGVVDALGLNAVTVLTSDTLLVLILVLCVATCLSLANPSRLHNGRQAWWQLVLFLGILFLHLQFAKVGWLYRYEAYLVAVALAITLPELSQELRRFAPGPRESVLPFAVLMMCLVVLAVPFAARAARSCVRTTKAMCDRYLEHVQPARFLIEYYPSSTVVVNDIGAVAYFTDCRVLDMYGLGSMEPAWHKICNSGFTKEQVESWMRAENAEIAILQIQWDEVRSRIPDSWRKVAEWKLPRNVVFGDTRVAFFAVKPEAAVDLGVRLLAFREKLPGRIEVNMTSDSPNQPVENAR